MATKNTNEYRKAAQRAVNGCPLMDGREKADASDYEGVELTIADAYPMTGENGTFYCVICEDMPGEYFFSGGALTNALNAIEAKAKEKGDEFSDAVKGIVFEFEAMRKTSNGRKFRPVKIL